MIWTVLVRPEAEQDLGAARDWYEQQGPGLGDKFLGEFAAVVRKLESQPERVTYYYRDFRRLLFRHFPYKVFYQVIGERVVVFRVLHAKQAHESKVGDD